MKLLYTLIFVCFFGNLYAQNPDFRDIKIPKNVFITAQKANQKSSKKEVTQVSASDTPTDSLKIDSQVADSVRKSAPVEPLPIKIPIIDTKGLLEKIIAKNHGHLLYQKLEEDSKGKEKIIAKIVVPQKVKQEYEHIKFIKAIKELQAKIDDLITENPDDGFDQEQLEKEDDNSLSDFSEQEDGEIDEDDTEDLNFNVGKSLVRSDTTSLYDVNFENIVMITEELAIDCVWITLNKYYEIWDSENINPYKFEINTWSDTIAIKLYDSAQNRHWKMPLATVQKTSEFGRRWGRWHHGVDLDLNTGDPVYAAFDGIVRISRYHRGGYGNFVVVRHHNGLETLYGHLSKAMVQVGDIVKAGTQLGEGGSTGRSTGPHLHYEVRYRGYAFNPEEIYDFENNIIRTDLFLLSAKQYQHLQVSRNVVYHIVKKKETLSKIAVLYKTSVRRLCRLNRISSRTRLYAGRRIRVE